MRGGDAEEAVVVRLLHHLRGPDRGDDDAGAGEGDAQRQGGGGDGCELHVDGRSFFLLLWKRFGSLGGVVKKDFFLRETRTKRDRMERSEGFVRVLRLQTSWRIKKIRPAVDK